jgi:hypothetical protein
MRTWLPMDLRLLSSALHEPRGPRARVTQDARDQTDEQAHQDLLLMFELREALAPKDDPDGWLLVAYALAREFIPAFKLSKGKRGRKKQWGIDGQVELIMRVRAMKHFGHAASTKDACRKLEQLQRSKYRTTELYRRHAAAMADPRVAGIIEKAELHSGLSDEGRAGWESLLSAYLPSSLRADPDLGPRMKGAK